MKKFMILLCLCFSLFLMTGCQKGPSSSQKSLGNKSGERTAPDDDHANHGVLAIMETENGYYYNYGFSATTSGKTYTGSSMAVKHLLRYYDKATGETILLCSKPECEHQGGASCAATYKNMQIINSLLYGGQLYIYGLEQNQGIISMNLYRASLDGSSLDKVGTVLEAENTIREGISTNTQYYYPYDETFIIHKGYAYLPYYLRIGAASKGFMGGGVVQMDLSTGKTKIIYEMEYLNSNYPYNLKACGDYVYMDLNGTKRYVISEDRLEYPPSLQEERYKPLFNAITKDRLYSLSHTDYEDTDNVITVDVYDSITGASIPEKSFETDLPYDQYDYTTLAFPYDGMLVIASGNRVVFYAIEGDKYGTKLSEIDIEYEQVEISNQYIRRPFDIKITNEKLYLICNPTEYNAYTDPHAARQGSFFLYQVFSCPVEDVLKGQGTWEKVFEFRPE